MRVQADEGRDFLMLMKQVVRRRMVTVDEVNDETQRCDLIQI